MKLTTNMNVQINLNIKSRARKINISIIINNNKIINPSQIYLINKLNKKMTQMCPY